jgi:hypothetical protein
MHCELEFPETVIILSSVVSVFSAHSFVGETTARSEDNSRSVTPFKPALEGVTPPFTFFFREEFDFERLSLRPEGNAGVFVIPDSVLDDATFFVSSFSAGFSGGAYDNPAASSEIAVEGARFLNATVPASVLLFSADSVLLVL